MHHKSCFVGKLNLIVFSVLFLITFSAVPSWSQHHLFKLVKDSKSMEEISFPSVSDKIVVYPEKFSFTEFLIYDERGSAVKQGWFLDTIMVKQLRPGRYFLVINNGDKKLKTKFIKL